MICCSGMAGLVEALALQNKLFLLPCPASPSLSSLRTSGSVVPPQASTTWSATPPLATATAGALGSNASLAPYCWAKFKTWSSPKAAMPKPKLSWNLSPAVKNAQQREILPCYKLASPCTRSAAHANSVLTAINHGPNIFVKHTLLQRVAMCFLFLVCMLQACFEGLLHMNLNVFSEIHCGLCFVIVSDAKNEQI